MNKTTVALSLLYTFLSVQQNYGMHFNTPDEAIRCFTANDKEMRLIEAAGKGNVETVMYILHSRPKPNIDATDGWGKTALHAAAHRGNAEIVDVLLRAGAEVNTKTKDGITPLMAALSAGCLQSIGMLIRHSADCTAVDNKRRTIYIHASLSYVGVSEFLEKQITGK